MDERPPVRVPSKIRWGPSEARGGDLLQDVLLGLADNPALPESLFERLAEIGDEDVREPARGGLPAG